MHEPYFSEHSVVVSTVSVGKCSNRPDGQNAQAVWHLVCTHCYSLWPWPHVAPNTGITIVKDLKSSICEVGLMLITFPGLLRMTHWDISTMLV